MHPQAKALLALNIASVRATLQNEHFASIHMAFLRKERRAREG